MATSQESLTWVDPKGVSHPLDGSVGVLAVTGEQGNYYPPVANVDQRTPLYPGTLIRYVDVQPRLLTYPLEVVAADEMTLRTLIRNITGWFNTSMLPGTLQAVDPDGVTRRQIGCYYAGGLEGDGSDDNRGGGNIFFPLQLEAPDPFWTDLNATVVTPAIAQPSFLSSQFLPMLLGGSTLATSFQITNNGDWETWPIWTIHGPGTNLTITNLSTGKSLALTANGGLVLGANQILTIDCSFGKKTILTQDGASQAGFLQPGGVLFSLGVGLNILSVQMGGTTGQSSMQMQYKQRYLSV
jgi:hypothetical protein